MSGGCNVGGVRGEMSCIGVWVVCADLSLEDSGNYTCEVRGPRANALGDVTHYIFIRGM